MSLCDMLKQLMECTVEESKNAKSCTIRGGGASARRGITAPGKWDVR